MYNNDKCNLLESCDSLSLALLLSVSPGHGVSDVSPGVGLVSRSGGVRLSPKVNLEISDQYIQYKGNRY